MRHLYYPLTGLFLLLSSFSSKVQALTFYADALYFKPSESVDWALTNSNISASITPNQQIAYKTIKFDYSPGFRVGAGIDTDPWITTLLYTHFATDTEAHTEGHVISTFMPSKFSNKFYQSGDVHFAIDVNMLDLNMKILMPIDDQLTFKPLVGIRAGTIDQTINTQYQNPLDVPPATFNPANVVEHVTNDFSGIGPTVGLEGQWMLSQTYHTQWGLFADLIGAYLWGKWSIHDTLYSNNAVTGGLIVGKRDFGALTVQGFFGIQASHAHYDLKIGYEVSDWFNQYQVFDNGSGTHTNDLVFQGLTLALRYSA